MASFTDDILKFNPYVQEAPVETMVQVGMYKQQLYDQGVQKVQGYLDTIRGMDIAKDVHKDYLQQRMNQLKGEVTKVISADFSKSQLTDQIGSLATRVAGDPIIQNALQSTQRYKSEIARLQKDKADGKAMVQNEYDFQDRASKWLTDGDAQTPFNESYSPYVDIMGEFLKAYKEVHPDSEITQDAFRIGKDGKPEINPALEQKSIKGIDPNKVASVANMVFQRPEIQNQLRIEGKYNYRGATPQLLLSNLTENYQNSIDNINRRVEDLKIRGATSKNADKAQISRTIEQLNDQGTTLLREYKASANMINTNPEMYKTYAYKNNLKSQLITNYSWHDTAHTFEKSPVFDGQMEVLNYELKASQFQLENLKFDYQKVHDAQVLQMDWAKAQLAATAKGRKLDSDGNVVDDDAPIINTTTGAVSSSQGEAGAQSFYAQKEQKKMEFVQASQKGVFELVNNEMSGVINPIKLEGGVYKFNVDLTGTTGYTSIEKAREKYAEIYSAARKEVLGGSPKLGAVNLSKYVDPIIRTMKAMDGKEQIINKVMEPQIQQLKATVGDLNSRVGTLSGKQVTNNDLIDVWLSNSNTPEAKNARARLRMRFPNNELEKATLGTTDDASGVKILAPGTDRVFKRTYEQISKKLGNNKNLIGLYNQREQAFKDAQTTFIPLRSAIEANKPAEKEKWRTIYANIASSRVEGNSSKVIEEFQDFLKKEGTSGDDKFTGSNIYGFDKDDVTGETYLTVGRGGEKRRIKVPEADLASIPGATVRNQFWNQFGGELSLSGRTTTDIPQPGTGKPGGASTAHSLPRPSKSQYITSYHVTGDGKNYNLKFYVRDAKGNVIANDVNAGLSTSMEGIMQALESFKNDKSIEMVLDANGIKVNK